MGYSHQDFYQNIHKLHKTKTSVPTIDAHNHLMDFMQETGGIEALSEAMEKGNIKKSIIFGMPVVKKWAYYRKQKPSYYLSDNAKCYYYSMTDEMVASEYLKLSANNKQKFAPLICGFNPTDVNAAQQIEYLLDKYPFWKGLGEILFRHDDLTNLTMGEVARPNHPAMFPIYQLCADRDLPIMIHQNATSSWEEEEGATHEYLEEFIEILDKFQETTFIWAHCGASRRTNLKHFTGMLQSMLEKYPKLYMDISWVVYDDMICENGEPKVRWIELFEKFPDRFFIGSDLLGHYQDLGRSMARYNPLLKSLSKETAKMMAYDNANKMWFSGS